MDDDEGGSKRTDPSPSSVFQSTWIQRAIRRYNESHTLLLENILYLLRYFYQSVYHLFNT